MHVAQLRRALGRELLGLTKLLLPRHLRHVDGGGRGTWTEDRAHAARGRTSASLFSFSSASSASMCLATSSPSDGDAPTSEPERASAARRVSISDLRSEMSAALGSRLTRALLTICFAESAYLSHVGGRG